MPDQERGNEKIANFRMILKTIIDIEINKMKSRSMIEVMTNAIAQLCINKRSFNENAR